MPVKGGACAAIDGVLVVPMMVLDKMTCESLRGVDLIHSVKGTQDIKNHICILNNKEYPFCFTEFKHKYPSVGKVIEIIAPE